MEGAAQPAGSQSRASNSEGRINEIKPGSPLTLPGLLPLFNIDFRGTGGRERLETIRGAKSKAEGLGVVAPPGEGEHQYIACRGQRPGTFRIHLNLEAPIWV